MKLYYRLLIGLCLAVLPILCYGQKSMKGQTELPLDPEVHTGKLANGFTYYIRHNGEPKNRVYMYIVNKAGSILEDEDQRGLAHFTEHMSFNGTVNFPHNELVNYLQKAGIRFGADINAYTSFDETVYQLPLPADNPEILAKGIQIMHDWAQSAMLDASEINKERGVVLEEKRLGKGAAERMQRNIWPVVFNHSRYAGRIPIGLDTVLNNFKRSEVARFYHDWYRPDLQALIIVGDINADSLETIVKARFSDLKNPQNEKARTNFNVPLTGQNQFIVVTDKEMTSTTAEVIIKHPLSPLKTIADYRVALSQNLFNQMLANRYEELTRQSDPPFVAAGGNISEFIGGLASFDAQVDAKPGKLEQGFKALWRETERVKRFGFTQTELTRAKQSYLNAMEVALQEKDKTNSESFVKEYQEYFLKAIAAPGIIAENNLTKVAIPGITLAEVNQLAADYIKNTDRDIVIEAPEKDKASLPNEAIVNDWLTDIGKENLQPYQDEVSNQPLLSSRPVAGKIVAEKKAGSIGATMLTLSNGLKIWLKPTAFKNDEIIFSGFAPGGTSLSSDADYQSAASAGKLISACGAGNYSTSQLEKYLEGKQLSVRPFITDRSQGVNGSSTVKDLETALQMVYAYFTEPRKDSVIFRGVIERGMAALSTRSNDPNNVFNDTVSAVLSNYNDRRTAPSVEKFKQIELDNAFSIYKQRFADASNFTFTFVGNVDTSAIKPLLEKYLGALPTTRLNEQPRDLGIHIPGGRIEKKVYKGSEPKSTVLLIFSGLFDFSQENNLKLDALKETLEIRLLERLREDESGVYSPAVFEQTTKLPHQRYSLMVQFGCAPQNVDKLIVSTLDEIDKLRKNGPSQQNLDKWRAEEEASTQTELKTNKFWLDYISGQIANHENIDQIIHFSTAITKVSVGDLKAMANRYLSGKNYIRLVLMPVESLTSK